MIDPQFRYYTVGAKNVFNKAQVARAAETVTYYGLAVNLLSSGRSTRHPV